MLTYRGLLERNQPDLNIVAADLAVSRDGRVLSPLFPERRVHAGWEQQPITGVAINTYLPRGDDLYVLLSGWDETGAATFRIFVNPLVGLIWLGGVVFVAGTLVAAWPERRLVYLPARAFAEVPAAAKV
jgi:cytochrome c-type biogenesis protein CcmF